MRPNGAVARAKPEPACERSEPACGQRPPACEASRAFLRRNAAPRTRVRRFERRAQETARRLIREPGGKVEPAGVEPVAS
jgi:hypothetical protein